ncbi:hypothetical protein E5K00_15100 [Hymenobacter aquaticus]|uniref:Uncharacterized protein n=1 Tax=Hymenobacter aquaticus TaxID=1867101 RepID=A0A4Z0PWH7_9BACT|nr:hypothetical protein [Hymenobacter aquaticus]TGE21604.1 hypothetical protein E5K00_15100 [Hymenobacter aquaticus]
MPLSLRHAFFPLLLAGLFGRSTQAQHVTIDSIRLAQTGGLYLPSAQRAMMFSLEPGNEASYFRQYVFSPTLGRQRRQSLRLPGRYVFSNSASSRQHVLYQLYKRGTDTMTTVVLDTLGQVVKLQREKAHKVRWRELGGSLGPQADGFLLAEPGRRDILVRYLNPQLQVQWEHRFTSDQGAVEVEEAILDSTHAWLLVTTNATSRRAVTKAYALELASGKVLCRLPLDHNGERRVPGVAQMGAGHSLLLAGYSYPNNRPSRTSTGSLFVARFHPDSTRTDERLIGLSQEARLLTAQGRKVLWQRLRPEADGGLRLVGETYTSTSLGGHMAIGIVTGIATLGIVRVSTTTLRPRDVVSLRVSPGGQVDQVRVLPLPDGGSYTVGGYLQARRMAQQAALAGVFRLRGFAPDSNRVVLRTERRILTLDVRSGQPATVQQTPSTGYYDVWFVDAAHLLLYHEQRSPQRVDLERIAY